MDDPDDVANSMLCKHSQLLLPASALAYGAELWHVASGIVCAAASAIAVVDDAGKSLRTVWSLFSTIYGRVFREPLQSALARSFVANPCSPREWVLGCAASTPTTCSVLVVPV